MSPKAVIEAARVAAAIKFHRQTHPLPPRSGIKEGKVNPRKS